MELHERKGELLELLSEVQHTEQSSLQTEVKNLLSKADSADRLIEARLKAHVSVVIQDHLVVPKINEVTAEHHNLSHHG